jgi:DNA-binding transcriptional LysR family regulator
VSCEVDHIVDLVELVAHGLGVSLMPPAATRLSQTPVVGVPTEPRIPRELVLVTPLDRRLTPAADALVALVLEQLDEEATASWAYRSGGAGHARRARVGLGA